MDDDHTPITAQVNIQLDILNTQGNSTTKRRQGILRGFSTRAAMSKQAWFCLGKKRVHSTPFTADCALAGDVTYNVLPCGHW
jgi:hypothetical protein